MNSKLIIPVIFLLVGFYGCNNAARERQAAALITDANKLVSRDTEVTAQWSDEFVKVFTPKNRAQFPANRDFLRGGATRIIKLLDESTGLNNSAAEKFEQAARLLRTDQLRRGMNSLASAFRKTVEVNELLKAQMQMVSDETVVDEKVFNEKFSQSWELIKQKNRERDRQLQEGQRLLGWKRPQNDVAL